MKKEELDEMDEKQKQNHEDEFDPETWFDPEHPDFFADDEEEEDAGTPTHTKWIKRTLGFILVLALLGNALAFWPQVYSLPAIQFLQKNRELAKNEAIQQYKQAVVVISTSESKGTGFNIEPSGMIITNYHVIEDASNIRVTFPDGRTYLSTVSFQDESIDTAILELNETATNLPVLPLDPEGSLRAGMPVYFIGNPLFFHGIANEGRLAGQIQLQNWAIPVLIVEAPIYKGNSGSPVINEDGKVVAVIFATTKVTYHGQKQKVGLAIPMTAIAATGELSF